MDFKRTFLIGLVVSGWFALDYFYDSEIKNRDKIHYKPSTKSSCKNMLIPYYESLYGTEQENEKPKKNLNPDYFI